MSTFTKVIENILSPYHLIYEQNPKIIGLPVPSTGSVQDFTKVTLRELPTDGTVIMHYGPIDESDPQASHCCPLVLPNTVCFYSCFNSFIFSGLSLMSLVLFFYFGQHCADLLAAQLQRLVKFYNLPSCSLFIS